MLSGQRCCDPVPYAAIAMDVSESAMSHEKTLKVDVIIVPAGFSSSDSRVTRVEPLGASAEAVGSESLPALLHHCITKAKGEAANNNNNTDPARRTGVSPSQTRQRTQTPQDGGGGGNDLDYHRKRKRQNKKNPYFYLTSFLHRRKSAEDQTGILASADTEGPNYGTLR
ncbi:hypothetical protein JOB18_011162 [Solea senegalensis]|uniref:Uncharacterized protein n=1 Tax=Solea senegalensis TaxID=28829 RepID=A0AAV6PGR1_SOLSE|nr:hypothetical protein JOB18_011162 [Solea senegalensis]